jgi:hypothetical protein
MKRLLHAAAALVCAVGLSICAQAQMTSITATSIQMKGAPIASGTVTFIPTNSTGQPVPITAGGSLYDAQGFTAAITNGAIADGFEVPDGCTSSPVIPNTSLSYAIQIYNSTSKQSFTLQHVTGVCGESWALDSYVPTQTAVVSTTGLVSGSTVPAHCKNTSIFYTQTSPSQTYTCVSGIYVQLSGSGGGSLSLPHTTGLFKGDGNGGAVAATAGTDYATPASVTAASNAASAAQSTADAAIPATQKAAANGLATLDGGGHVPASQMDGAGFVRRGLVALYLLNEGSGATTILDSSGSNACAGAPCNLVLSGSTAPVMSPFGLDLKSASAVGGGSQYYLNLPAPLSGFASVTIGTYVPAPPNGSYAVPTTWASNGLSNNNNYSSLLTTPTGMRIMAGPNVRDFSQNTYIAKSGPPTTQIVDTWVGAGTRTWVLGTNGTTDLDHIYLNGSEAAYIAHGFSNGSNTGQLTLGNMPSLYPTYQTGFPGVVGCMAFYSVQLTSQEALKNNAACNQLMAARGVPVTVAPSPNLTNQLICTGDSIFSNIGGTTPVCQMISGLNNIFTITENGMPGWPCKGIQSLLDNREAYLLSPFSPQTIGIVECGNNDKIAGSTNQQVADAQLALAKALRRLGAQQVFMTTLMSSVNNGTTDATFKDVVNPMIRSAAAANGFGLIDYGSIPELGADGAGANATYFRPDGIHPTNAGKVLMAAANANAINEYGGTSLKGGCSTAVSSETYTEAAADGCIQVDSTANAVAVTLPSCSGYSKARYLKNISTGSNAVTVAPASGQNIDGSASAITIGNGATLTLYPRVTDSTGTCQWQRLLTD